MVDELILDVDGDTSITADTDDQIDFKTGGSDRFVLSSANAKFNVGAYNAEATSLQMVLQLILGCINITCR